MKRVLVIFTGGTIGSQSNNGTIHVQQGGAYRLIDDYGQKAIRTDVRFDSLQPINLLSENIVPADWHVLASVLRETDLTPYAGVIITHGSDTLAYSAAMLSYLFADIAIPLVLTASNQPLDDPRSNGGRNFSNAVDFIADQALPGVYVVYENDEGHSLVYLGTRITTAVSFTDQYGSPYGIPYGKMENQRFMPFVHERNPLPAVLMQRRHHKPILNWAPDTLHISDEVLYIKPYPGLNYSLYRFEESDGAALSRPRAILHDLHHSGTANAAETGPYSLPAFIERCSAVGIPVYICPIRDASAALYSSTRKLIDAGAIIVEGMSSDAALMKLMLGVGTLRQPDELKRFMTETELFFEFNKRCTADGQQ